MDFSLSVEIVAKVVEAILPFLVVITVTIFLLRIFLKSLRGRL